MSPRSPRLTLLALLAAAMFLSFLGRREFAASHEARVGQVAREMAESGWPWNAARVETPAVHLTRKAEGLRLAPDPGAPAMRVNPWVVPILNGQVRLQKPPLPYWGAAVTYRVAGVSEGTTRFVPAVLGVLATLLLFDLAGFLYGARVAWASSLIWLTTFLVAEQYRLAMADPYLAFFTLAAVWAWVKGARGEPRRPQFALSSPPEYRGRENQGNPSSEDARVVGTSNVHREGNRAGGSRFRYVVLFYVALALGALAKGPLVFLVAIPIVVFHACFRWRLPRPVLGHVVGVVVFAAIALPWPVDVMRQVPNATELWRYESLGEVTGANQENVREWWYYVANLPLMSVPWVAVGLFAIAYPLMRNRSRVFFPLLWYVVTVGFFSVAGQKKLPYLLPMLPAQALMLGVAAVPLLRLARRSRMRRLPGAVVAVQALIGLGWAVAVPVMAWQAKSLSAGAVVMSAVGIGLAVLAVREALAVRTAGWFQMQALAYAVVLVGFSAFYLTPVNNARSPVAVAREVAGMADGTHTAIVRSRLPEEVSFYLPLHPNVGPAPRAYLAIVDDHTEVERRARSKNPAAVAAVPVPSVEFFKAWVPDATVLGVRRVEMRSAPGDARWKVYEIAVGNTGFAAVR